MSTASTFYNHDNSFLPNDSISAHLQNLESNHSLQLSCTSKRSHVIQTYSLLKGNSTFKNISPKINMYEKWIYASVIKLTMQIRYRRILMIKLLISRNVFLHGGGSSKPSSLFLYLCLFVDVDMITKNGCSYVLSCVKNVRCFHCLAGNSAIIRSTSPTLFYT